ncbi:immunoglobulin I-set domain protein [Ostertagia ostertagi]
MTLSLKKVRKLATESAEPSTFVQIEIIKPNEHSEEILTIVNTEKLIPDLLRVAAAASKLKVRAHSQISGTRSAAYSFSLQMENVTVSLVKQGDTAHQELVIEYESHIEDAGPAKAMNPSTYPSTFRFTKTLQDCQTVIGRSAQFKCIVSAMPPPEVAWYVDGDVIQSCREYEIVYEDGVCILRINEALAEDEGEYSCEAKNSAGKAVTKCYLKVLIHSCRSAYVLFCVLCLLYVCCLAAALPTCMTETENELSPLSISEDEPQPAPRFIEHVPSVVELVDEAEDSFDSFEWEENKANKLFPSDTESLHRSSVTYNSEFDLSRIVSYNEDLHETNAFHRYFDTAETGVRIMEWEQRERVYASFPKQTGGKRPSAAHLFAIPSLRVTHADVHEPPKEMVTELERRQDFEEEVKKEAVAPREPDLPLKMSYKGQEIAISVNEIEKEEVIVNENGEMKISKKTCLETSFEFDTELDITQSIRKIRNALPEQNGDFDDMIELRSDATTGYPLGPVVASPVVRDGVSGVRAPEPDKLDLPERPRAQSVKPNPRLFGQTGKSVSEGAAKLESTMFDPEFLSKMKEIERVLLRQVDEELGHLSSSPRPTASPTEDLMLARPITEAQAEANEELLRTTLADMILNPTRTAAEEIELMTLPPTNSLRKKSCPPTSELFYWKIAGSPRNRVPSADYLRVTPLTSTIKDQLSSLEEMISAQMNGESTTDDADVSQTPVVKVQVRKETQLHDLCLIWSNKSMRPKHNQNYCQETSLSPRRATDGHSVMDFNLDASELNVTSIVNRDVGLTKKETTTSKAFRQAWERWSPPIAFSAEHLQNTKRRWW